MMCSSQGSQSPASSGSWMATSSSGRAPLTNGGEGVHATSLEQDKVIPKHLVCKE